MYFLPRRNRQARHSRLLTLDKNSGVSVSIQQFLSLDASSSAFSGDTVSPFLHKKTGQVSRCPMTAGFFLRPARLSGQKGFLEFTYRSYTYPSSVHCSLPYLSSGMLIARVSAIPLAFSASTEVKNQAGIFTALECVERSLLGYK